MRSSKRSSQPRGRAGSRAPMGQPRHGKHPRARCARPNRLIRYSRQNKMISRILVPIDARPPAAVDAPTQRRRPTTMDTRTLVPAMLPIVSLNGQSSIHTNLPLESVAARVVVPRDLNSDAYGVKEDLATPLQPTDMDERITVPQGAAPLDMN